MALKTITLADIRSFGPCYDPIRHAPEGWTGTALDVLKAEHVPAEDRLWVALRPELLDNRMLRLFAVWCARQALVLVGNSDPRSVTACDVAERYANGKATNEELAAAWAAASAAAWAATSAAAKAAASAAARGTAWDAARNAARSAASAAAWDVARGTAWDAARNAARSAQVARLIVMLEA